MAAYRNPPQATAETIDAQGWLRTGDAGSVDADRYLYIEHRVSVDVAAEFQKRRCPQKLSREIKVPHWRGHGGMIN